MSQEFPHSIRNAQISEEDRENALLFIDSNQRILASIASSETAMQVRNHVIEALGVARDRGEPLTPLSRFESAVLSEAVGRWNKLHPLDKSNE